MYKKEQKALLVVKDQSFGEEMASYLNHRYNLRTQIMTDILEVFREVGADDSADHAWDLVIFDEAVAGLQPASHALKTLKTKYTHLNVLYLSTILEVTEPYRNKEMAPLPEYLQEDFRTGQINSQLDKLIELLTPVTKADSLADVYETIPRVMAKTFRADWAVCSVLRLDEKPVQRAVVVGDYPEVLPVPTEFRLKGRHLEDMLTYFKPVHIPDLDKDKGFRRELEKKFIQSFHSALMLPLQYDGNCIGLIGLFTHGKARLYRLPDLDMLQRLADMATVAIVTHFYHEHGDLDIDAVREEIKRSQEQLGGEVFLTEPKTAKK